MMKKVQTMEKERNTETKQRLITTAFELFKQKGYEAVTINQICEAVGIVKNTFYYYFESKEALLEAAVGSYKTLSMGNIAEILLSDASYFEQYWQIQKPLYGFVKENGKEFFQHIRLLERHIIAHEALSELNAVRFSLLQKSLDAGEIRCHASPKELLYIEATQFFGTLTLWTSTEKTFDFYRAIRGALEICFDVRPDLRTVNFEEEMSLF
jgi:AcrR family transcriptional regulator